MRYRRDDSMDTTLCLLVAVSAHARPMLHCTSGGATFTASVIWTGATEEMPYVVSFYANTGECINIICADPNDAGDMWLTSPEGFSNRDVVPSSGNLEIEADSGASGDEGWWTFQMYTSDNATENFSCTCTRTAGGC